MKEFSLIELLIKEQVKKTNASALELVFKPISCSYKSKNVFPRGIMEPA